MPPPARDRTDSSASGPPYRLYAGFPAREGVHSRMPPVLPDPPPTAHKPLSLKQKTPIEWLQRAPPLPFETVCSALRRIATSALASRPQLPDAEQATCCCATLPGCRARRLKTAPLSFRVLQAHSRPLPGRFSSSRLHPTRRNSFPVALPSTRARKTPSG